MPTSLLLGQSGMMSEPISMYPQQEALTSLQQHPAHREGNCQTPASYVSLSPISPISKNPLTANQVVPGTPLPATTTPHSTIFVAESGRQEEEKDAFIEVKFPAQTMEKYRKLQARRYIMACTFCRQRKVSFISNLWSEHAY
jgi:hypothetical protein